MRRWLFVGAGVLGLVLLGGFVSATVGHSASTAVCPDFGGNTTEPEHGAYERDMYADEDGTVHECPVGDGARMGGATVTT
jgi:hypothetical protein